MLKDKVVIITGASKGLGLAMAQECASAGAIVVMAARSEDRLRELQTRIVNDGGQAHAVRCDVARYDDLQKLVDETIANYGRIDGLINNAGVNFVKPFLETTEAEWDHVMDVDLKGSFFLTQLCARQMVKQGDEMGFIKFGSRVDLLLPLDCKINVKIGDKPQGGVTVIATW